ncbi:MAG: ABC transporter substrate-binding protein [Clostridia bacterium]|nr:ABC transporter substrate-binding protein [Clostridia bacterium]
MKPRRIFAMLLALALLLYAAPGASGAWMSAALAEAETGEEQVLVFKTYWYQSMFDDAMLAEAFNKTHPGKRIVVEEIPSDEALATELMSGSADYMLNLCATNLDAGKCAAGGVFVDLYDWMDADPDFHREDYYENLFEAMEYQGHLYGIAGTFSFPVVLLNRPIAEALGANYEPLDAINIAEILDLYEAAKAQGLMAEDVPPVFEDKMNQFAILLDVDFSDYVDMDQKTSHFSDPDFIELLERTKGIYTERRLADGSSGGTYPDRSPFGEAILAQKTSSLLIYGDAGLRPLEGGTLAEPHEALMGPLIQESVGGGSSARAFQLLMVPTSCSNPELAWEFIKFCIGPMDEEIERKTGYVHKMTGEFPISKANLAELAKYNQTFGKADFDACLAKLEERIGETHEFFIYKLHGRGVVYPILEQYFDYGTITAEECAKQMDERLYLYLNE